jgi:exosortase/archaeosortase
MITRVLAAISLLACLAMAYLFFTGAVSEASYKTVFALASLAWFVFATLAIRKRSRT